MRACSGTFARKLAWANGVVVERDYKAQHISGGDATSWIETGSMQVCTFTPTGCQDDCSRGPVISSLAL